MARRVPGRSDGAAAVAAARREIKTDDYDDDQDDLYSDPFRDHQPRTIQASRQISHTPGPQSRDSSFNSSPLQSPSHYPSDKENAPQISKHRGSGSPLVIKKESGLSSRSRRTSPYSRPSEGMSSKSSRPSNVSKASIASTSRTSRTPAVAASPLQSRTTSKATSERQQPSRNSLAAARESSAAPSRTSRMSRTVSHAPSRAASEAAPDVSEEEEEEEEDDDDVSQDAEQEEDMQMQGVEVSASEDDEVEDPNPQLTQRSRISETPAPKTPRESLASQRPLASQMPSGSQFPSGSQAPSSSQRPLATQFYDPHQSMVERRRIKGQYNDIQQELVDNKKKLISVGNDDLFHYMEKTNELFTGVKQTSDAIVDGRIQVEIGKLAAEKAKSIGNSSTNTGLDMDEFLNKMINFMSKSRTGDSSDGHDWAYLGREVATPAMKRARPSDFMLGPLAVQRRTRIIKQRKQAVRRRAEEFVKPIDLDEKQIAKNENSTTKNVVLVSECLDKYIADNDLQEYGVNYFNFVINPKSFSQTIENMFYLAFLVRDGRVAIMESEEGLLYILGSEPPTPEETKAQKLVRKQIVMPMEKRVWRELIEAFEITESIIPMRPREVEAINGSGWYS